ncbi:energy-coupling factor ABC transporter permease [Trichlorobacter lovleyi]|uniref:energy-coupling factor ABC transporter permease n=1 Tax=Trichlorobacter lovleyi TaxID=313985 RepID=UPI0023F0B62F|nr:energy-coupling factor ABC transporter permease [Trichlorobacter lovleyi]
MHMADALVSPAVGGVMWAVSAGAVAYSSARLRKDTDERRVPLMGVMGAFLFAAQMINFSIPGTGSSGHLGGGLLLAILLGPHAALLAITGVLIVQALFFADGGLLALGCNIFNMGVIPAFLVYPLVYKKLAGQRPAGTRLSFAVIVSAVVTLQLGPFAVVLETLFSGLSALPFTTFLLLMQPVHLAIGLVEGVVTAAIVSFVYLARPELMHAGLQSALPVAYPLRNLVVGFLCAAILTGGVVSLVASNNPDGLEWAITRVAGTAELKAPDNRLHSWLAGLQETVSFLPDYAFKHPVVAEAQAPASRAAETAGTSLAGLVGVMITLLLLMLGGALLKRVRATA